MDEKMFHAQKNENISDKWNFSRPMGEEALEILCAGIFKNICTKVKAYKIQLQPLSCLMKTELINIRKKKHSTCIEKNVFFV